MSIASAFGRERSSATRHDLRRFWHLTWTLAATDFKLRFYGSALGYLWTLVRPFLFFLVIYFVFSEIAGLGTDVKNYGLYILFGLVLFQFFSEATSNSVQCLVIRENMLRKMRFPRLVIPLAVIVTATLNLAGTLLAVFVFALATGVYPTWGWLELPLLILIVGAFATGVGLLLSSLYVRYRDVQPIWEVVSQMLFYASPILYVATFVPEHYHDAYFVNPLAVILTEMRAAIVDPGAPHVWDLAGNSSMAGAAVIVLGAVVLGILVFSHKAPRIAEDL